MHRHLAIIASLLVACVIGFYLGCLHHTEPGTAAIMRNVITGDIWLDKPGWTISPPWVQAAHIELRPMRVCISTAGRGFSCKLVQFEPEHFEDFVDVEGFRYYWWANRISFNVGYNEHYRGFADIMRGHAYGAQKYPFIKIQRVYTE